MRFALILSGQVRCFDRCFPTQKKFLIDALECDVFFHFWNTSDLKNNIRRMVSRDKIPDYEHLRDNSVLTNRLINLYNPKEYIIEDQIKFDCSSYLEFRFTSMFYSMLQAYNLCKAYGNYDCIIRARTDLFFKSYIYYKWIDNLNNIYS